MPDLLLGCGNSREKKVVMSGRPGQFVDLVTLDIDPDSGCDVVFDLDNLYPTRGFRLSQRLPFENDHFDEVHAYEVMEHIGQQGHAESFFAPFEEIWRVLKPGGLFCATVPAPGSPWVWGDPGHRRVIQPESLVFLDRAQYEAQVGITPMTDYRWCYGGDFEIKARQIAEHTFAFVLKAHKPARY